VCAKSLDEQLSEVDKTRGIYGVVRNAYRMWPESIKGHVRNLSLSGRILINVYTRILSQYISIHSEHLIQ
jgi:hypothetical protein